MKLYELSFINEAVKEIFMAFEEAQTLIDDGKSIKSVVCFIFDKYSSGLFTVENLNKVRDCARVMCTYVDDLGAILRFCDYAEIARGLQSIGIW